MTMKLTRLTRVTDRGQTHIGTPKGAAGLTFEVRGGTSITIATTDSDEVAAVLVRIHGFESNDVSVVEDPVWVDDEPDDPGAPAPVYTATVTPFSEMSRKDLRVEAKRLGIKGYSKMPKDKLIELIRGSL